MANIFEKISVAGCSFSTFKSAVRRIGGKDATMHRAELGINWYSAKIPVGTDLSFFMILKREKADNQSVDGESLNGYWEIDTEGNLYLKGSYWTTA